MWTEMKDRLGCVPGSSGSGSRQVIIEGRGAEDKEIDGSRKQDENK